ncbi:MAG TPA: MFS transporter, partial [Alphaproteobacteria bacterium]|nr:MFS transporter [Alphaproteobacteria bacterium]
ILMASLALPKPDGPERRQPVTARDLMPRLGDYMDALRMMAIPAILLVVMASTLRMSGQGMYGSFYVVYLDGIGLTGTLIGVLLGIGSVVGFAGALSIGPLVRRYSPNWLLIISVAGGVLCVSITPLLGGIFALLLIVAAIRGGAMALAQPLMISILAQSAGSGQGMGVGLRTTANRLVSFAIPVLMGAVVEVVGLEWSFYIIGGTLIVLCFALGAYAQGSDGAGAKAGD